MFTKGETYGRVALITKFFSDAARRVEIAEMKALDDKDRDELAGEIARQYGCFVRVETTAKVGTASA